MKLVPGEAGHESVEDLVLELVCIEELEIPVVKEGDALGAECGKQLDLVRIWNREGNL